MKQLFETDELIGKTIKGVYSDLDTQIIIGFTDMTFVVIADYRDYYEVGDSELTIDTNIYDEKLNRENYYKLYAAGLVNKYVYDELHDFFTKMIADEQKEAFLTKRREEIHKLQQLAQKYPEIATLKP